MGPAPSATPQPEAEGDRAEIRFYIFRGLRRMAIVTHQVSINGGPALDMGLAIPMIVEGLTPGTYYSSFRIREKDGAGNVSEWVECGSATTDAAPDPVNLRVNAGQAAAFSPFVADTGGSGGTQYNGLSSPDLTGLTDPAPAGVYNSKRYADPGNSFTYTFTVNASVDYLIRLHHHTEVASAVHQATINGVAKTPYDPYVDAGNAANKGFIKEYTITQGAGTSLTIEIEGDGASYSGVCGIEVLEVLPMSISTSVLDEGTPGSPYSDTLVAENEVGSVTWAITSGSLPAGLSLNASTGVISGTPTTLGLTSFVIQATDSDTPAQEAMKILSINVEAVPSSYLLDDITATPLAAYSTRLLRAAYAGDAIRVRRLSDNTETDIGFNANGNLDQATAFAFGDDLEIVKWYDQMENDDLVESSAAPALSFNYFLSKRAGIDWGSTEVSNKHLSTAGTIAVTAPKVFTAADLLTSDLGWSAAGVNYFFDFNGNNYAASALHGGLLLYNGAPADCGRDDGGRKQRTFWFTTGTDKIRIDGVNKTPTGYAPTASNAGDTARTEIFALGNYGLGGTFHLRGAFGEAILLDGTVSDADRDEIEGSQSTYFVGDGLPANPLSYTKRVHLEGDSRTYGFNTMSSPDTQSYAVRLDTLLDSSWSIRNVAYSGHTLIGEMTPQAALTIDTYYNSALTKNIVVIWGIINDLHFNPGGYAATDLYDAMEAYCQSRQAAGYQVIVCTDPDTDHTNGYITAGDKTVYTAYNALVRADHSFADGFVDLELVSELSDATDTTYFDDGTHLTLAGANKVADAVFAVLNSL